MSRVAVAVLGAGATAGHAADRLRRAGVGDIAVVEDTVSAVFDDGTDTWTLTSAATLRSRVVVDAGGQTFEPWIPAALRDAGFGGEAFHSCAVEPGFDPAGKRIAVVGGDAAGGSLIEQLSARAAAVTVFAVPPRRVVPVLTRRLARTRRRRGADVAKSPVDAVTATGIRTRDGADHEVDVIIYSTGLTVRAGSPLRQDWRDGAEPYAGVAVHGCPNRFWLTGPDHDAQLRHIVACLRLLDRTDGTRIEVRRSSQQVFNERVHLRALPDVPVATAYDVSCGVNDAGHVYDGPATLTLDDTHRRVHVRLTGHLDPLDGKYHWQGTILDPLPDDVLRRASQVTLDAGSRCVGARITERSQQGAHSIAGVGAPPFALTDAAPVGA